MNILKLSIVIWLILMVLSCTKSDEDFEPNSGQIHEDIRAIEIQDSIDAYEDSLAIIATFNQSIFNGVITPSEQEFEERPNGEPYTDEDGCIHMPMEAAAGHNEFLVGSPYSSIYPGEMYVLNSFEDGGLQNFPAELSSVPLAWDLIQLRDGVTCEMSIPSISSYRECQLSILGSEVTSPTPAKIEFEQEQIFSTSEVDLQIDASFSGFGAKVKGMFDMHNSRRQSHFFVRLDQIYYTVVADIQGKIKPNDFFAELPDLSTLSPDDQLVYPYTLKYGRRLILAVSSDFESRRVEKLLSASAKFAKFGGSFSLSQEEIETFEGTQIKVFIVGGSGGDAGELISDVSTLGEFLINGANYNKDNPGALLGFSLKYLKDHSIVKHVNTARYNRRDCPEQSPCPEILKRTTAVGGTGGTEFNHLFPPCSKLVKLRVRSHERIDKIQLTYELDGIEYSCTVGGGGGSWKPEHVVNSPIRSVHIWGGGRIHGLQFNFQNGTSTPTYGRKSGIFTEIVVDGEFAGMLGRSGDEIDNIQFYYRE